MYWPTLFCTFEAVFGSLLRIHPLDVVQTNFPQWFDSRRTGITARRLQETISDTERTSFKKSVSHKMASEPNLRDIRHFWVPGHIQQLSNLSSDLTQIAQKFPNFPGPGSVTNSSNSEELFVQQLLK